MCGVFLGNFTTWPDFRRIVRKNPEPYPIHDAGIFSGETANDDQDKISSKNTKQFGTVRDPRPDFSISFTYKCRSACVCAPSRARRGVSLAPVPLLRVSGICRCFGRLVENPGEKCGLTCLCSADPSRKRYMSTYPASGPVIIAAGFADRRGTDLVGHSTRGGK